MQPRVVEKGPSIVRILLGLNGYLPLWKQRAEKLAGPVSVVDTVLSVVLYFKKTGGYVEGLYLEKDSPSLPELDKFKNGKVFSRSISMSGKAMYLETILSKYRPGNIKLSLCP